MCRAVLVEYVDYVEAVETDLAIPTIRPLKDASRETKTVCNNSEFLTDTGTGYRLRSRFANAIGG